LRFSAKLHINQNAEPVGRISRKPLPRFRRQFL